MDKKNTQNQIYKYRNGKAVDTGKIRSRLGYGSGGSYILVIILLAVLVLTVNGFAPPQGIFELRREVFVDPWEKALNSYWGYKRLERQTGHQQAIQIVQLVETSEYPELVKAIIEVESSWRVMAQSRKDARGLMQIRLVAAHEVDSYVENDDLYDPILNVKLGIEIFDKHMEYFLGFDEPEHWALTSYNRGRSGTFALKMDPPETRYSRRVLNLSDRM